MATTLVLLPGLDGTGVLFDAFVAALPSDVLPVVVSYPGDAVMGYDELVAFVIERLPSAPVVVLGESFSGPIALKIASAVARTQAVVLCASFVRNPVRFIPNRAASLVGAGLFRLFPACARARTLLGGYSTPALRAALARAHALVTPQVFASRAKLILGLDAAADLRSCTVPVLYLAGTSDEVVRKHNRNGMKAMKPDLRIVEVSAPHLVLQTAPEASATAVATFISDTVRSN